MEHGVAAKGLYNPHTGHGDIVVDGVLVSTYGIVDARIAHSLLVIERIFRSMGLSALGAMLERERPWVFERVLPMSSSGCVFVIVACM